MMKNRTWKLALLLMAAVVAGLGQVTFTEYPLSTPNSGPYGITKTSDGSLWFTETWGNRIGRITPPGVITEFPIPAGTNPSELVEGPDGNIWFVENRVGRIGRITPTGVLTEFPIPTANSYPYGITVGPDGNLWFTESGVADGSVGPIGGNNIGRITPAGVITEFPIPTARSFPLGITAGPDGNLWFTEHAANKIGRITPLGAITEYNIPFGHLPIAITRGPDGNLWFVDYWADHVGKVFPDGAMTGYPITPLGDVRANGIAAVDGSLWITSGASPDHILKVDMDGAVTALPIPTQGGLPIEITAGMDGDLWFTELSGNRIGRLTIGPRHAMQVRYLANLDKGDSYVDISNVGALSGLDPAGRLCANVYVFDPNEEPVSCCACPVTPNGLVSLSARNDLISNTLTPGAPNAIVVKLLFTANASGNAADCDAGKVPLDRSTLARGGAAWATTLHANTSTSPARYQQTETPFTSSVLSTTELAKLTGTCSFIETYGSKFGLCKTCRAGAQGGGAAK